MSKLTENRLLPVMLLIAAGTSVAVIFLFVWLSGQNNPGVLAALSAVAVMLCAAAFFSFRQSDRIEKLLDRARGLAGDPGQAEERTGDLQELDNLLQLTGQRIETAEASAYQLNLLLDAMNDAVILTDTEGNIVRPNRAAQALLDYSADELHKMPIRDLIAEEHGNGFRLSNEQRAMETIFVSRGGNRIPVSYTTSRLDADRFSFAGYIVTAQNISERKVTEQRIRYLARIDSLTKLANRMQFHHLLQRGISRAKRKKHQIAMFYLDIDRFKDINDTYGHAAGDLCLETVADRLTEILPENAIIGRLAGDEFAAAIEWNGPEKNLMAYIQSTARYMQTELTRLLLIQGHEIHITISIGISCFPRDADNVIDLIRSADAALYRAKEKPGNQFEFFDARMNAEEVERLMLKSKLRRSYELDELLIHYQPKVDMKSGRVSGAEALVRWELSERGMILPSEFIPLAEETNLIVEIGEWVLDKVCADLQRWQDDIGDCGRIAVNLSLKQLGQPGFPQRLMGILNQYQIDPSYFELEITESTLMHDTDHTIGLLQQLHGLGLNLSIDDFGTGYSSLSALQQFPISTLKIDKSFVHDMQISSDGKKIVSAIIDLAHSMKMDVVAEGVESELQLRQLKKLNCDHVQGLLFGKPMQADDYFSLLKSEQQGQLSYGSFFGEKNIFTI